jgi:hypothetical protein
LEKIASDFFATAPALAAARSVVFAACRSAWLRPSSRTPGAGRAEISEIKLNPVHSVRKSLVWRVAMDSRNANSRTARRRRI